MTEVKTSGLSKPVGMMPEYSYGEPFQGGKVTATQTGGQTYIRVTKNVGSPDWNVDFCTGMIFNVGGKDYLVVDLTDEGAGVYKLDIIGTCEPVTENDPMYWRMIPIQHAISEIDPEEDFNRDTLGIVGNGHTDSASVQAGREFHVGMTGSKGRDLMINSAIPNRFSSLFALGLSQNGKLNENLEVVSRNGLEAAASVTLAWEDEPGQARLSKGCVLSSFEQNYEDGMDSTIPISLDFMGQRIEEDIDGILETLRLMLPATPYLFPVMRSHGLVRMMFFHKSAVLRSFQASEDPPTPLYMETLGFAVGDLIQITSPLFTYNAEIAEIDEDENGKYITLTSEPPADEVYDELTSWVTQLSQKYYPTSSFSVSLSTGMMLLGRIDSALDYKSMAMAGKMSISADIMFKRSSYLWYEFSRLDSSKVRLLTLIEDYLHPSKINVTAACWQFCEWAPVGTSKGKLTSEMEELSDEINLKNVVWPDVKLMRDVTP